MADLTPRLADRFAQLWYRLGALTPPEPVCTRLHERYSEPHRAYHTLTHLRHCLEECDAVRSLAHRADEVEVALWFHDAVYEPRAKDNEVGSAALAEREMSAAHISQEIITPVKGLILATMHDQPPTTSDAALVVDIDLAILGQPAARFDAYETGIRLEFAFVPDEQFRVGRAAILAAFLCRPAIFHTAFFQQKYEAAARANLTRSWQRLQR